MTQRDQTINLFNVYTILSIGISILGWVIVKSGLIDISEVIASRIGFQEVVLAVVIFGLGLTNVWTLFRFKAIYNGLFVAYLGAQILALAWSFLQYGWLYFPGAGSQGTIPAIAISSCMFYYLLKKSKKNTVAMS